MNRDFVYNIRLQLENQAATEAQIRRTEQGINKLVASTQSANSELDKMGRKGTSGIQKLGSAMYAFSSIVGNVADTLKSIASFGVGGVLTRGLSQLSSLVSTSFYTGLEKGITRFDVMKTFPQLVEGMELGTSADAEKVVNKLDMAVRGLPTSLDDIVSSAKDLMSITGDVNEAGDLAIAINNAILASGATEQQKYFATAQLRDLISVGQLTDREWVSLSKSIPLAMGKIARSFNLKNWKELQKAVDEGTVSVDDFKKKLIELGTGEGIFVQLANIQKTTIAGLRANITNAVSRLIGGKNGLLTIADEFSKKYLGANSLVEYLYGITTWIDKLGESMRKFTFQNSDRILSFIEKFTSYDWEKFIGTFFDFSIKKMEAWLKAMEFFGPRLQGMALSWGSIVSTVAGSLAKAGSYIAGFWGLQRLLGAGGVAGAAATAGTAGAVATGGGVFAGLGALVTSFVTAFKPALIIGGITAIVSGFATLDTWLIKKAFENITAITENIIQIVANIKKSSESLKSFSLPSLNNIGKLAKFVRKFYATFTDDKVLDIGIWDVDGQVGSSESTNIATIVSNMAIIIRSIANSAKKIANVKIPSGDKISKFKTFFEEIANLMVWMYDMRASDSWGNVGEGERIFSGNKFKKIEKNLKNVESIVSSISTFADTIKSMLGTLRSIFKGTKLEKSFEKDGRLQTMLNYVFDTIAYLNGKVAETGESHGVRTEGGVIFSLGNRASKIDKTLSTVSSIISSIAGFVTQISEMLGELRKLSKGNKLSNAFKEGGQLRTLLDDVFSIIDYIGGKLNGTSSETSGTNYLAAETNSANISTYASAMEGVVEIIGKVRSVIRRLNGIKKLLPDKKAKEAIINVAKRVGEVLDALWSALSFGTSTEVDVTTVSAIGESWEQITESVSALIETLSSAEGMLDDNSVYSASKKIREELKKLREAVKKTTETLKGIGTTWTDAMVAALDGARVTEAMNSLLSALGADTTIAWMSGWTQGNAVVRGMQSGMSTAPRLLGGAVDIASGNSQGGVIYRAFGGNIFKARGTDTVPAMLTPGEYVIRRSAVNAVGKEFMDRVNSLDFRGALTALSKRVGMGMIPSVSPSFAVTTNETTNHNGTINFNVNTNNPDYPHQVSGKWIRKLI